ncbi:hypothetical protein HOR43_gp55 [Streptomyces phage Ididsumtinwong]|uniref:Uncharacterized protein n=2 Tax=Austintatiousvirus ididsumtinwong TaxID=2734220 RepID=A0A1J0MCB4_9CAUD|nr:hypothetical protein HOR43_gp55 [Streptomyces phage Ididsumtinwong]APD18502.1 hypothetical protein SEA_IDIDSUMTINWONG_27 [Streptomyces phage Ididsumtinwong]APD18721.1 hypothetical protein SEA_BIOSCUM_27 [Streptomyces phage Bioscum]
MTDGARALAGQVRAVNGDLLTLARPGGMEWTATETNCWAASPEDREALRPSGAIRLIGEHLPPVQPPSRCS